MDKTQQQTATSVTSGNKLKDGEGSVPAITDGVLFNSISHRCTASLESTTS